MVDDPFGPPLFLVLAGFVGGLVLFVRGLIAYRRDRLVSAVATSSLEAIAAGEVRVSGVVEAIDRALVSPLQSKPCVWYRARVEETGENGRVLLNEERTQEFRIRDASGDIRVIPRGARWEIGPVFDESSEITGGDPVGLRRRGGGSFTSVIDRDPVDMTELERQTAIASLLTVQAPAPAASEATWSSGGSSWLGGMSLGVQQGRRYREARLEPGETVTIVGQALPWSDVRGLLLTPAASSNVETAIAADIAVARKLGLLAASPEEAWGNAAIPGFGIGRPTQAPRLDSEAEKPTLADPGADEKAMARFDIPGEELVLSRGDGATMAVYRGTPEAATAHHDFAFVLGVMGAIMAVVCALGLGAILTGTL